MVVYFHTHNFSNSAEHTGLNIIPFRKRK